jgi:protein TonB
MRRSFAQLISFGVHALGALALLFVIDRAASGPVEAPPPIDTSRMVYVAAPAFDDGGGGGGHEAPAPPRPAEIPRTRPTSIPVAAADPIDPPPAISAPIVTNVAAMLTASGVNGTIDVPLGGGGKGKGIGPGDGDGLGPGDHTGFGGVGKAGLGGVASPQLLVEVKPKYTPDAMQRKIQGEVVLEGLIGADGRVQQVRVVQSLDPRFGLDENAKIAAMQWRFRPCQKDGKPVACIALFGLRFSLR